MRSILTPLQITAASALLNNQGIKTLPAGLTAAINAFNSTTLITAFNAAVASYLSKTFVTDSTLSSLLTIGNDTCPALGNSIPVDPIGDSTGVFDNLTYPTTATGSTVVRDLPRSPYGFSGLIQQTGQAYLGDGDIGRFAQGFMAVQGFITITNDFINSAVNVNQYLGPTFTDTDALSTFDVTKVSSDTVALGVDLHRQGNLWNPANLDMYGTPAALLQQLSAQGNMGNSTLPCVNAALQMAGLTDADIVNLISNNRQSLFNPNGLSTNQFDRLQQRAYQGMNMVSGDCLTEVLDILNVTTSNINDMADLLDPAKVFPISFPTLKFGDQLIYGPNNSVNSSISQELNASAATGCDELGKIIPPAQAVANKALQSTLSQVAGIANTELPALANAIRGIPDQIWDPENGYIADALVSDSADIPTAYRAQQDVPPGTDLTDTDYWEPTTLCAVNTMEGLPDLQQLTTPVPESAVDFFENSIATGTGPDGTITVCDMIGTAVDYNNITSQLTRCTEIITELAGLGALTALTTTYNNIAAAASDGAVIGFVSTANTDIDAVIAAYPAETLELNEKFVNIAGPLNTEKGLQIRAGIDYFNLIAGEQTSVMSFVQNLTEYAQLTAACQAAQVIENISDTTTVGGQATVGAMREARTASCLQNAGVFGATQVPASPVVTPSPAVRPVPNAPSDDARSSRPRRL